MNWYSIFYWITVADGVKEIFDTFSNIFTAFAAVGLLAYIIAGGVKMSQQDSMKEDSDDMKITNTWMKHFRLFFWISFLMCMFTWLGWAMLPTKKDALLIVAGGGALQFLTTDSSAKQLPAELSSFVVGELKVMAKEAKIELVGLNSKEMILDKAKTMTADELMKAMQADTSFANVILNR